MGLPKKAIVKRQYSRAGCIECKRRKIKCNEAQPTCGNCARVRVQCIYPDPNYRNKPRKSYTKSALEALNVTPQMSNVTPLLESVNENYLRSPSTEGSLQIPDGSHDMMLFDNVFDDANNLVYGLADFDIMNMRRSFSSPHASTNSDNLKPFHSNIILNEPQEDNILFNDEELKDYLLNGVEISTNHELDHFWNQFKLFMNDPTEQHSTRMSNAVLILKIVDKYKLSQEEHAYFKEIMQRQLFLYIFPFASSVEDSESAHVLLEYCLVFKFLVYAILSLSASCHFTITKEVIHDRYQKKFTAVCVKLLVSAFEDLKNNEHSLWHIEGLIITVLLLTMLFSDMSFVDSTKVPISWVSHLKEAKLLLLKYNAVKSKVHPSNPETPGILMAKLIFFCYEWISKLSMPAIDLPDNENDEFWSVTRETSIYVKNEDYYRALFKLGLMIPPSSTHSGFNLFVAMTNEAEEGAYKLLSVMSTLAKSGPEGRFSQLDPERVCDLMATISKTFQQVIIPGASSESNFLIDISNPSHPYYAGPGVPVTLPTAAYGKDSEDPLNVKFYSYCDVAQKLHGYFLYLKVLTTKGLMYVPRDHPSIRSTVDKTMKLMFFVKSKQDPCYSPRGAVAETEHYYLPKCLFDLRTIMIQLPFRMCIDLTDKEDDFEKLELFFKGLLKLGSGNCSVALHRIKKNREAIHRGLNNQRNGEQAYLLEAFPVY
ncbi:CIC11C00000001557 [Sungouiella intermedia]|uniref:CIC11C00000001557 n=1 Tax=Sungouiella intermedia TaxID=45354 RepID=A0A1L0BQJ9_9ASCO|nr:CIC11C00000001557 [[Candida] intermedia]